MLHICWIDFGKSICKSTFFRYVFQLAEGYCFQSPGSGIICFVQQHINLLFKVLRPIL